MNLNQYNHMRYRAQNRGFQARNIVLPFYVCSQPRYWNYKRKRTEMFSGSLTRVRIRVQISNPTRPEPEPEKPETENPKKTEFLKFVVVKI